MDGGSRFPTGGGISGLAALCSHPVVKSDRRAPWAQPPII